MKTITIDWETYQKEFGDFEKAKESAKYEYEKELAKVAKVIRKIINNEFCDSNDKAQLYYFLENFE